MIIVEAQLSSRGGSELQIVVATGLIDNICRGAVVVGRRCWRISDRGCRRSPLLEDLRSRLPLVAVAGDRGVLQNSGPLFSTYENGNGYFS